jgi:o-succinylbenzoate synthase
MLSLYAYKLPFKTPFKTGAGVFTHREGFILHFSARNSSSVTEIAPLPGFSKETFQEVEKLIISSLPQWNDALKSFTTTEQLSSWLHSQNLPPSVEFGLSALGLDILSRLNHESVMNLLGFSTYTDLNLNFVISAGDTKSRLKQLRDGYKTGFRTFKIKSDADTKPLFEILDSAHKKFPDIRFRVDANRSWDPEQALQILKKLKNYPVEYCEEPVLFGNILEFSKLCEQSPVPLALDESLGTVVSSDEVIRNQLSDVIIIKPALFGSVFKIIETIDLSDSHNSTTVFTTTLESGVGRKITAWLAAMTSNSEIAHGLNTGSLLGSDLLHDDWICNASICLKPQSGWGFEPEFLNTDVLSFIQSYG